MKNKLVTISVMALSLVTLFAGIVFSAKLLLINGAGATFPYPIYSKWFYEYAKIDRSVNFNYQSIGSGGGIKQITARTVDFGATDGPMTDDQLKNAQGEILHIPAVAGAVAVIYNLKNIESLKLKPDVLADIFLGRINNWNDAKIAQDNPGLKNYRNKIIVVHRSDGSGTSFIFTDYLSEVSREWKSKVGKGTAVNWKTGLGGKGNEGVAGQVKNLPGSIGYAELAYAIQNKIKYAGIRNVSGKFIIPTVKSTTSAVAGKLKSMPADFRASIVNSADEDAYPISGFTWILVYKDMTSDSAKGKKIVGFLKWAIKDGQKYAEELHYAPLPEGLTIKIGKTLDQIKY